MKLVFKECKVVNEWDFIEDDIEKVGANMVIYVKNEDDIDDLFSLLEFNLQVISINTDRGTEMDEQRKKESTEFINNKFKE
jgi:hypothetical protein